MEEALAVLQIQYPSFRLAQVSQLPWNQPELHELQLHLDFPQSLPETILRYISFNCHRCPNAMQMCVALK